MALESKKSVPEPDAEGLSACMDGALGAAETQAHLQSIAREPALSECWQTYHLIGDVLRSSDLARVPDDAFMLKLRAALATEPVVLAPQPSMASPASRALRRWRAPAAAVASVALVAGGMWRMVATSTDAAGAGTAAALAVRDSSTSLAPQAVAPTAVVMGAASSAILVRDVQLERYLSAHKQFAGATALGEPSGFVKASLVEVGQR